MSAHHHRWIAPALLAALAAACTETPPARTPSATAAARRAPSAVSTASVSAVAPWLAIDPAFKGCAGG